MRVKCLPQEHDTMSPARARTRNTRSGVERTNHEATAPLQGIGIERMRHEESLRRLLFTNPQSLAVIARTLRKREPDQRHFSATGKSRSKSPASITQSKYGFPPCESNNNRQPAKTHLTLVWCWNLLCIHVKSSKKSRRRNLRYTCA